MISDKYEKECVDYLNTVFNEEKSLYSDADYLYTTNINGHIVNKLEIARVKYDTDEKRRIKAIYVIDHFVLRKGLKQYNNLRKQICTWEDCKSFRCFNDKTVKDFKKYINGRVKHLKKLKYAEKLRNIKNDFV